MNRHNSLRLCRNQLFNPGWVHGIGLGINITEYGRTPTAYDGVRGGGEGEGRGDDFPGQAKRFNGIFKCQVPVGIEGEALGIQIGFQGNFELLVLCAHVGEPMSGPDIFYFITIF